MLLENVRVNYLAIKEMRAYKSGEPAYSARLIIPKKDKEKIKRVIEELNKTLEYAIETKKFNAGTKLNTAGMYICLRDGDTYNEQREKDGRRPLVDIENSYFINARNKKDQPTLAGFEGEKIPADTFYDGCYVNALINFGAYKTPVGMGIAAYLNGLQFRADGEPIGSGDVSFAPIPESERPTNSSLTNKATTDDLFSSLSESDEDEDDEELEEEEIVEPKKSKGRPKKVKQVVMDDETDDDDDIKNLFE